MKQTGIAVGLKKGYPVTKLPKTERKVASKGKAGPKTQLVREVIRELAGLAPYEKRMLDVIKTGGASSEKRLYKFAKKRLGTHKRAMQKREEMKKYYGVLRAKQAVKTE